MATVIVTCAGTVGETTVKQGGNTVYVATCSQPWQTLATPANTPLDAQEFAGFFLGVLIRAITQYLTGRLFHGILVSP